MQRTRQLSVHGLDVGLLQIPHVDSCSDVQVSGNVNVLTKICSGQDLAILPHPEVKLMWVNLLPSFLRNEARYPRCWDPSTRLLSCEGEHGLPFVAQVYEPLLLRDPKAPPGVANLASHSTPARMLSPSSLMLSGLGATSNPTALPFVPLAAIVFCASGLGKISRDSICLGRVNVMW